MLHGITNQFPLSAQMLNMTASSSDSPASKMASELSILTQLLPRLQHAVLNSPTSGANVAVNSSSPNQTSTQPSTSNAALLPNTDLILPPNPPQPNQNIIPPISPPSQPDSQPQSSSVRIGPSRTAVRSSVIIRPTRS